MLVLVLFFRVMRLLNSFIYVSSLGLLLCGCTQDPLIENNDPVEPLVELDVTSRISGELSIVSTSQSSDFTYGAEIIRIVNGAESEEKFSFTTKELDENHRYSWLTEGLQPNSTYMARSYLTNGRDIKYSTSKTYSTPSTSKPTLSAVTQEEAFLVATIVDNGGRSIEETGFVVGDTPNRKDLIRKEKIPASKQSGDQFSLPMSALSGGKTYYAIAYALDEQEDVGYSAVPFEVFVPQYAKSVTLSMTEATLPLGSSITLEATVSPEDAMDKTVTWESSNPEIALVQGGLVTGLKEGKSTIIATVADISATCEITVMDFSVSFEMAEGEVYVGENFAIEATILPESLTGITLTWESSDPSIAWVAQDGYVTPVGVGDCTITASAFGQSASYKCSVVSEAPVFPDPLFREYVYTNFDTNKDGFLSRTEALSVEAINISGAEDNWGKCYTLEGIEHFIRLRDLSLAFNNLTELNISNNSQIVSLNCGYNQLTSLDISKNPQLFYLSCYYNQLTCLDISNNPRLVSLYCGKNQLTSLDISENPQLRSLDCGNNQLASLIVSNNPQLEMLFCQSNPITDLDISNCPLLRKLQCGNDNLTSLDVSYNPQLSYLFCRWSHLFSLNVSNNPLLRELNCSDSQLSSLDISNNPQLVSLYCSNNHITSIDVSSNPQLEVIHCGDNQISSLNVLNNSKLTGLYCYGNPLTSLDLRNNPSLATIYCYNCSYLTDIWLIAGHEYETLLYDQGTATLHYE